MNNFCKTPRIKKKKKNYCEKKTTINDIVFIHVNFLQLLLKDF